MVLFGECRLLVAVLQPSVSASFRPGCRSLMSCRAFLADADSLPCTVKANVLVDIHHR